MLRVHTNELLSQHLSTVFGPRNISTEELSDTGRANAISEAQLDMTWSNDFMLSVKHTGKKNRCNLTALHKEPFVSWYFFSACVLLSGVHRVVLEAQGEQSWREQCGNPRRKLHMLSFLYSLCCDSKKRLHLYRPFHTATSSITADRLDCTVYPISFP